jgi:hypothetical protein
MIYIRFHFLDKHAKLAPSLHNVKNVEQEQQMLQKHPD